MCDEFQTFKTKRILEWQADLKLKSKEEELRREKAKIEYRKPSTFP